MSILFNDLDAVQSLPEHSRLNYCKDSIKIVSYTHTDRASISYKNLSHTMQSNTQRLTRLGLELMRSCTSGQGIIVNCASILGFMGWPLADDSVPVYCSSCEPVLETTIRMAVSQSSSVYKTVSLLLVIRIYIGLQCAIV